MTWPTCGVAMMLAQSRGMIGASQWVRDGSWESKGLYPLQSRGWGKKVRRSGSWAASAFEVAKRLAGFDLDIAYSDVSAKDYAPDWTYIPDPVALAQHADFLFVTLAASAATRHIVGKEVLDALGPNGMVINISRAANIDEEALLTALETKTVRCRCPGRVRRRTRPEPPLLALDNVMVQPHHASGTYETRKAMGKLVHDNLVAHFSGEPLLTK